MRFCDRKKLHAVFHAGALILFIMTLVLTPLVTWYLSDHFLQGDLSSDLLCANHLFETGKLLAKDWYGSTELRILRAEWIFMPLFALFEDWRMVRFVGTIIMQALIVLSFGYLMKQTKTHKSSFFLGASVLLVPYNFAYGVNVIYGCFYATFAAMVFLCAGLVASLIHDDSCITSPRILFKYLLLTLLGFIASLGGPRLLLNISAPLFLTLMLMLFRHEAARRRLLPAAAGTCLLLIASVSGYVINSKVLVQQYHFYDFDRRLEFRLFELLNDILTGILYNFGFQEGPQLISKTGILSMCGALVGIAYLCYCIQAVRRTLRENHPASDPDLLVRESIKLLTAFVLIAMVAFKSFTTDIHYNETYYLLVAIWFIPCLAVEFSDRHSIFKRTCVLLACMALYLNGIYGIASFVMPTRFPQYSGVTFQYIKLSDELEGCTRFLQEEGYTFGYASAWNANVVTEKTDGAIDVAPVMYVPGPVVSIDRYYWLTTEDLLTTPRDRAFLLFTLKEEAIYQREEFLSAMKKVYSDDYFSVYEILEPLKVYEGLIQ